MPKNKTADPLKCPKCGKTAHKRNYNGKYYRWYHRVENELPGVQEFDICTMKKEEYGL
jgi:hypothetical protein